MQATDGLLRALLKGTCIFALVLMASRCFGAEQLGPVYPIAEPNILEDIERVLRKKESSGELQRLQKEAVERSKKSAEEPRPVAGIGRVQQNRTFYWDPSVTANEAIKDASGNVIVQAGQKVNPLDYVSLSKHLFFFDGRDPAQVIKAQAMIQHYGGMIKPILVAGPVAKLSRDWKQQVYFDQGGALVRKLGIVAVPALVSQQDKRLRIDEIAIR